MSDTKIRPTGADDADAIAAYRARDADAFAQWGSRPGWRRRTSTNGVTGGTERWRNAGGQVVVRAIDPTTSEITAYASDLGR